MDSFGDTMKHIGRVREILSTVAEKLENRGLVHDRSKLEEPEKSAFDEFTPKLRGSTYGSPEYKGFLAVMKPALDHHYEENRHHPEFQRRDEEWRPVQGFEGHYEVSNYGDVRSLDRTVTRSGPTGDCPKVGRVLKQYFTPKGYCRLQIVIEEKRKNAMVHRLVAEAFIPNPESKSEVNHKNGIKHDNGVSNLEWVSPSENQQHAYDSDLKQPSVKYVVTCEELDITTLGCDKMAAELQQRGYEKAAASGIWRVINHGGTHLDLTFTGTQFEEWTNSPVNGMTLIDLVEMLCDWKAASERHTSGDVGKSIELNQKRFGINDQLRTILENTAKALWPKEGE